MLWLCGGVVFGAGGCWVFAVVFIGLLRYGELLVRCCCVLV